MVGGSDEPTLPGDEDARADGFASTVAGQGVDDRTAGAGYQPEQGEPLPRGTKIGGFIVEGPLGTGAMGTVLLARDPELARPVAIKLVAPGRGGEAAHQRLLREAQAAARLSHPNVVAIHQAGTWRDQVFIVMEYVDGGTLTRWLEEAPRRWEDILDAFHQAGEGLLAAHRAGLVHRDFKPDNVLVGRDGRVRVSDFGLVGVEGGAFEPDTTIDGASLDLTRTGALLGTPAYMAPEQFEGSRVDARADQFAFAVSLYEAFYGQRPFVGTTVTNLLFSMSSGDIQPPPSSHVPRPIYSALMRALASNPEGRFPSMAELLAALRREPESPTAKHGTMLAVGLGAVVVAAGGTAAFFVLGADDPAPAVETPTDQAVDCDAQPGLDGVWNDERRASIVAAFERRPESASNEAASAKVVSALDRYSQTWRDTSREACTATHVDAKRSEEELALQTACLDDRRAELEVFLAVLAEEDAPVLSGALGAVARLAPIRACSDLGALRSLPPPPEEPELREAVEAVRRQRAHAAILLGAGHYSEALSEAETALQRAEATGYEPEIVRVQVIVAEAHLQLSRPVDAEPIARNAIERAAAIREHSVEAVAWQMVLVCAYTGGRLGDAPTILESAKAAAARAGDPHLDAMLLNHEANIAYYMAHAVPLEQRTAKLDEAREKADAAIVAFEALPEPTLGLGNAYVAKASVDAVSERAEPARESYAAARRIFRQTVGEGHVVEAAILQGEAVLAESALDHAEAAQLYRQAADLYLALDPHHFAALLPLLSLSQAHQNLGETAKVEAVLEEAVQVGTASDGSMHPALLQALQRLGELAWLSGRWGPAQKRYRQAQDVAVATYGEHSVEVARTYVQLAVVEQSQGDFEGSVPLVEKAVEVVLRVAGPTHALSREHVAFLGDTYARLDRCDDALSRLAQADTIASRGALPEDLVSVQTRIARGVCRLNAGDLDAAELELEAAATILPGIAYPGPMAPYLDSVRARVLLARGKADEARGAAQIARDGFVSLGMPYSLYAEEMRELIAASSEPGEPLEH